MVKIRKNMVPAHIAKNVTYDGTNSKTYIVIHETDNTNKGANADAHGRLQASGNSRAASWQYSVDDKEVVQSFSDNAQCWAAGNSHYNKHGIQVEICVNEDGDYLQAVKNAIELTITLMKKHNIPLKHVIRHYDASGKNCPRHLMSGSKGINWNQFKSKLTGSTTASKPKPSAPSTSKPTGKGDMKTTSIVTYLNSIGENSTYAHRAKLAKEHGIKGYVGTAAQNTKLLNLLRGESKPQTNKPKPSKPNKPTKPATKKYKSIVDYLNDHNMGSSFSARKALASRYGIKNYTGSSAQNVKLLNLLQGNKTADKSKKSIKQMADEVAKGLHGNGNAERQKSLGLDNATYAKVRAEVNKRF